jgi:hypothetical protein
MKLTFREYFVIFVVRVYSQGSLKMSMADLRALERETDEKRLAREDLSRRLERIFSPTSTLSGETFTKAVDFTKESGWHLITTPPVDGCTVEQFLASYTR